MSAQCDTGVLPVVFARRLILPEWRAFEGMQNFETEEVFKQMRRQSVLDAFKPWHAGQRDAYCIPCACVWDRCMEWCGTVWLGCMTTSVTTWRSLLLMRATRSTARWRISMRPWARPVKSVCSGSRSHTTAPSGVPCTHHVGLLLLLLLVLVDVQVFTKNDADVTQLRHEHEQQLVGVSSAAPQLHLLAAMRK